MLFKNFILVLLLTMASTFSQGQVLFEGWFEIYVGAKKVGFSVQRYEMADNKFKVTHYLKTSTEGNSVTESIKAFSDLKLNPTTFNYTTIVGDKISVIDGTFKGQQLSLKLNDGTKVTKQTKKLQKGTGLASNLLYLILFNKEPIKLKNQYNYTAVAEDDGVAYNGIAYVASIDKIKGRDAFKIMNRYKVDDRSKEENYYIWVTGKGEVLLIRAPSRNVEMRAVANQEEATKDFKFEEKALRLLFGNHLPGEAKGTSLTGGVSVPDKPADEEAAASKKSGTDLSAGDAVVKLPEAEEPATKEKKLRKGVETPLPGKIEVKDSPQEN